MPRRGSKKQKASPESEPEPAFKTLPAVLEFDILSRLEGKEVRAARSVCKFWNLTLGSRSFLDHYRKNRKVMLYHSSEPIPLTTDGLRFRVYSTHMSLSSPKEFRVTLDLPLTRRDIITQVVDGLVCVALVDGPEGWTTPVREMAVYNVFTGEKMVLPTPRTFTTTVSSFHLGYDPIGKKYKVLRIIYPVSHQGIFLGKMRAKVMNIEPSSSDCLWRSLRYDTGGLECFRDTAHAHDAFVFNQARTFPGDSALSWFALFCREGLYLFDLNEERFRKVQYPGQLRAKLPSQMTHANLMIVPRITLKGISLWIVSPDEISNEWYVTDDEKEWNKVCVQLPDGVNTIYNPSVSSASSSSVSGELMLVDPESMTVYYYPNRADGRFLIGRLPDDRILDHDIVVTPESDWGLRFDTKLTCMLDGTHSYLPLAKVLTSLE